MTVVNTATGELLNSFDELETIIEQGLHTFLDVGSALGQIRDRRLYRSDFDTFEAYCQDRWGMDRRSANRTIEASEVVAGLGSIDPTAPVPTNLGQARELSGMDPEPAAQVMREAHKSTDGNVTARSIREARTAIVEDLSHNYVDQFPALAFFRDRNEHQRVNALGRDLAAMEPEEQARRLEILDKTIAYEKRKEIGEAPRHLQVVDSTPTQTPRPSSNPDADSLIECVRRITHLLRVVDANEVDASHYPMFFDVGLMVATFANDLKES